MTQEEKLWYRPSEVAKEVGVSKRTVIRWIHHGIIRAKRLPSGYFRIPAEEVERLKAEMEYKPPVVVPQESRKFRGERERRKIKTRA